MRAHCGCWKRSLSETIETLRSQIAACTHCAKHLGAGPRPVVQFSGSARILIIGQAPGSKVHATGVPWDDPSGERLREWTGIKPDDFYNADKVALMPMGFCYPGKGKGKSGDLPPRKECAPLWHERILEHLPEDRLTLLVGSYAQVEFLPESKKQSLSHRVQNFSAHGTNIFPLPHPSWRVAGWMKKNPWFEADVLPELKRAISEKL